MFCSLGTQATEAELQQAAAWSFGFGETADKTSPSKAEIKLFHFWLKLLPCVCYMHFRVCHTQADLQQALAHARAEIERLQGSSKPKPSDLIVTPSPRRAFTPEESAPKARKIEPVPKITPTRKAEVAEPDPLPPAESAMEPDNTEEVEHGVKNHVYDS